MSRLDWFTITVVGICLAAIVFLISKAPGCNSTSGVDNDKSELEIDLEKNGLLDDDTIDPDNMDGDVDAGLTDGDSVDDSDELMDDTDTAVDTDDGAISGGEGATNSGRKGGSIAEDAEDIEDDVQVNTSPSRTSNGDYMVIAGSFSLMHNAENFVKKLNSKGFPNATVAKFNTGKFASVIVDYYDSGADASEMVKKLKAAGVEAYVQRKK